MAALLFSPYPVQRGAGQAGKIRKRPFRRGGEILRGKAIHHDRLVASGENEHLLAFLPGHGACKPREDRLRVIGGQGLAVAKIDLGDLYSGLEAGNVAEPRPGDLGHLVCGLLAQHRAAKFECHAFRRKPPVGRKIRLAERGSGFKGAGGNGPQKQILLLEKPVSTAWLALRTAKPCSSRSLPAIRRSAAAI
ncbi:hypothetical protein QW131_01095 [Roseibium salinum]|nr:hypothetical protein [Roseibium salinum]